MPVISTLGLKLTTMMLLLGLSRGLKFPIRTSARFSSSSRLSAVTVAADAAIIASAVAQHPSYEVIEESMITEYGCKAVLYRYNE